MLLVLLALALLAAALVVPAALAALRSRRGLAPRRARAPRERGALVDPGRERRAEQRARELLRSCVNGEEWAMYRDLGFIRVFGRRAAGRSAAGPGASPAASAEEPVPDSTVAEEAGPSAGLEAPAPGRSEGGGRGRRGPGRDLSADASPSPRGPGYAYLLYPHKPILAYEPETHRLLSEYCVEFPDLSDAVTGSRLPESDDVLAKWMALTGDEPRLLRDANMHLPGRQLDPGRVRRDLWRLGEWERRRRSADASSR